MNRRRMHPWKVGVWSRQSLIGQPDRGNTHFHCWCTRTSLQKKRKQMWQYLQNKCCLLAAAAATAPRWRATRRPGPEWSAGPGCPGSRCATGRHSPCDLQGEFFKHHWGSLGRSGRCIVFLRSTLIVSALMFKNKKSGNSSTTPRNSPNICLCRFTRLGESWSKWGGGSLQPPLEVPEEERLSYIRTIQGWWKRAEGVLFRIQSLLLFFVSVNL